MPCDQFDALFWEDNRSRSRPASRLKSSLEKKIAAGFAVAALVLLLVAVTAAWNARRFHETFELVERSHQTLSRLESLAVEVLTMQSATRGFVLSSSETLIPGFERSEAALRASLAALRRETAHNPQQQRRLDELEPAVLAAIEIMNSRIAEHRRGTLDIVPGSTEFLSGQRAVERLRSLILGMQQEERRRLVEHTANASQAAIATTSVALGSCGLAIVFLLASGLLVRRDVRQRLRAEESLRKSERMFQRLFDNAPDAMIQVDPRGHITRANRRAEQLFGWERDELTGQRLEQLLPQRFHARHVRHFAAYFTTPRTHAMGAGLELYGRRKDDTEFPVDLVLSPLETDEGPEALAVIRDITERKRADARIRELNRDLQLQNARLEVANKELESFSYSVSHDLRAPLRHIDGFAALLAKHAGTSLDEKATRYLTVISDSARRMGRLVDDLLKFSRMGRAEMDVSTVDHNELVAGVVRDISLNREKSIDWKIEPLPAVRADAAMLRQVWANLIENAVKYSSRNPRPHIEIGSVPQGINASEHVFYVRDNGVGFDMKYAAKLFGVFQRLHADTEFQGTGIGLANVRRIVTRHGGRTWAQSSAGQGATFFFSLPVQPT